MVKNVVSILGIQDFLRDRHTNGVGDTLPERTGSGFDTLGLEVFWMTSSSGAELSKSLDVFEGDVFVTSQIEETIDEHGSVSCGKDESISIRPVWIRWVELQEVFEQDSAHVSHSHGETWMSRIGFLNGVHTQESNSISHFMIVDVFWFHLIVHVARNHLLVCFARYSWLHDSSCSYSHHLDARSGS